MPSRSVKARSESLRAGMSTMIAAKRQSELIFKPACFVVARESTAPSKDPDIETLRRSENSRDCPGAVKGSRVPHQSALVFFGLVIMMPTPRWFPSLRDPRRWPPSRHGGRDETSCSG
jgi:hypothetical protein